MRGLLRDRLKLVVGALLVLSAYVGSYWVLSRRGMAEAKAYGAPGFHYISYSASHSWEFRNGILVCIYFPLNKIDVWMGTGMPYGSSPTVVVDP
jgi:hypothetical protein